MMALIHSELIKGRHSFTRNLIFLFTFGVSVLALILNGFSSNAFLSIYNWWYMMFLPASVILLSTGSISLDKRRNFINLTTLPYQKGKSWLAKVGSVLLYTLIANSIIFSINILLGTFLGSKFPIWNGLLATIILTVTIAWQIPLCMFLATRFNTAITFLTIIVCNIVCGGQTIAGGELWWIPFAIPARLMAPVLKMNPNGLPLDANSILNNMNVVIPGIIIQIVLFILLTWLTKLWFERNEG